MNEMPVRNPDDAHSHHAEFKKKSQTRKSTGCMPPFVCVILENANQSTVTGSR
jgi:hypothetical protein